MAALHSRCRHLIFVRWLLLSFFLYFRPVVCYGRPMEQGRPLYFHPVLCFYLLFFSSPNLSSHTLDDYDTSTHDVILVQIQNAGLKCAGSGSLEIQDCKGLIIMVALCNRADHNIFILQFLSSFYLLLLFIFPRLISAVGDWMSTILLHMAWPQCEFRMQV